MRAAITVEALKLRQSLVGIIATTAIIGGTIALLAGITAALASGNPQMIAKAGPGATRDWTGLLSGATQVTAAAGLLGFGVVLAWLFAREFTDATITGLFALPVGRGRIATAKLTVYAMWVITVSITLTGCLIVLGLILGYGSPSSDVWGGLGRQLVLTVLTGTVALPTAWVATMARSLLAGIGCAIGLVVTAQVGTLAGTGGWMPLAAPALWAMNHGTEVTAGQLTLTLVLGLVFAALTRTSWNRQMNR